MTAPATGPELPGRLDVVVVGAGFGGMYALHVLRERGFEVRALEAGDGVGGTWSSNRYPGARCDVESLSYQYSFSQELVDEWTWTERYATQPEILAYAEWVSHRLDLRRDIHFGTRVVSAELDEQRMRWVVTTGGGDVVEARFVVTATGALSAVQLPPIEGAEDFAGPILHPGRWPEGTDLTGRRVAVVGAGSSAVQLVPIVARQASSLTVFQRTPAYSVPARNRPLYEDEVVTARRHHAELARRRRRTPSGADLAVTGDPLRDLEPDRRETELERAWKLGGNLFLANFPDVVQDLEANEIMADFVRRKIHDIVSDPAVAERLTPRTYPIGAKRIVTDTDYYATFNRSDVELVDVRDEPIERITPSGVRTSARHHEVDVLVCATGYDSLTGPLTRIDIRGRDGVSLRESWRDGAHTYLGLAVAGFPNLFTVTGPQSPSVLVNMFAAIEQHVEWIADCIARLAPDPAAAIEASEAAEAWWDDQVERAVRATLYLHAQSWYRGTNVEGKPSQFLAYAGGLDVYRGVCDDVAADSYCGFTITGSPGAGTAADVPVPAGGASA